MRRRRRRIREDLGWVGRARYALVKITCSTNDDFFPSVPCRLLGDIHPPHPACCAAAGEDRKRRGVEEMRRISIGEKNNKRNRQGTPLLRNGASSAPLGRCSKKRKGKKADRRRRPPPSSIIILSQRPPAPLRTTTKPRALSVVLARSMRCPRWG